MRSIFAMAVLLLSSSFAAAECNVVATNEKGASVNCAWRKGRYVCW